MHQTYCWWLKSCTTWDVWNPINNGIIIILGGAGFQPSTVSFFVVRDANLKLHLSSWTVISGFFWWASSYYCSHAHVLSCDLLQSYPKKNFIKKLGIKSLMYPTKTQFHPPFIKKALPSRKLTANAPEKNRPGPKRKRSYSNHPFSGANC